MSAANVEAAVAAFFFYAIRMCVRTHLPQNKRQHPFVFHVDYTACLPLFSVPTTVCVVISYQYKEFIRKIEIWICSLYQSQHKALSVPAIS